VGIAKWVAQTGVGDREQHSWTSAGDRRGRGARDTAHKAIYSFTTGLLAERLVPPSLESRRGSLSH
jgi:hypothetical protein